ncbi:MAG: hypothetical protein DRQ55_15300 [Planctomycetota bacterium]|nr:MAG: hypothetical protein DRQ55_15300 [Planctomycetota bacterium]
MIARSALLLLSLVLTLGCSSAGAWKYRPLSHRRTAAPAPQRVAVLPFEDRRAEVNSNKALIYLIPLMPYGWMDYDEIEGASGFIAHAAYQIRPAEDLAKAVVSELEAANLFDEVFYTDRREQPDVDLILQGYVEQFHYEGKLISYCLSIYGPLLWIFGLPAGHARNTLAVGLELRRAADGEVVWRSAPTLDERSVTIGLYYDWGEEFEGYPEMMQDAALAWVDGLTRYVESGARN